jgi:NHS family xanthosine MFS transporter
MSIRTRLSILFFLQFFVWGAWLISTGSYLFSIGFSGMQIGAVFSTLGISSLFMPAIGGVLADRWVNGEKLLGIFHMIGAACLITTGFVTDPNIMFWIMLLNSMAYMPTIALSNSVSYRILVNQGMNVQSDFPPIRVWGTVGFIIAMWLVDLTGLSSNANQYFMAAAAAIIMGVFSMNLPACPPATSGKSSIYQALGLDALVLFKQERMVVFFFFSMLMGAALQVTNTFGGSFLGDFSAEYPDSFVVKHELLTLSLSQISETLFILTIPFFLKKFGIKIVMILSMLAWVLRFGFFGLGNPGDGLFFLILSMIVYGMAFDFFNISGSLFVEKESPSSIRASAQGLFMMATNGFGAIIGSFGSGWLVDHFTKNSVKDWSSIWFCMAGYAFLLVLFFPLMFKYRHFKEEEMDDIRKKTFKSEEV